MGAVANLVLRPLALLPRWAKPAGLLQLEAAVRTPEGDPQPRNPASHVPRRSGLHSVFPAVAEVNARKAVFEPSMRQAEREQPIPVHVEVKLDGETIARATAKARRELAARQFHPLLGY